MKFCVDGLVVFGLGFMIISLNRLQTFVYVVIVIVVLYSSFDFEMFGLVCRFQYTGAPFRCVLSQGSLYKFSHIGHLSENF